MEDDSTQQQVIAAAPPVQRVIPPYQHFPFERSLLYLFVVCFVLVILPIYFLRASFLHPPFTFLCFILFGFGIILFALAMTIAEMHFRRSAVPVTALVTREERIIENYFTPIPTKINGSSKKPAGTKIVTIEAQFIAPNGENILLELPASYPTPPAIGQTVRIFCIPDNPLVASSTDEYMSGVFPMTIFYCLVGIGCIIVGLTLFR